MSVRSVKRVALAVGLLLIGVGSRAEAVSHKLPAPARPAPVSGKIGNDPAAVALRPAAAMPVVATSTARQVPPPANPNEPLFKGEPAAASHVTATTATPDMGAGAAPIPVSTMPASTPPAPTSAPETAMPAHATSASRGKPHVDHTEGKKLPESTKGHKKARKVAGHKHADKRSGAGRRKTGQSKGAATAGKAHVNSAQANVPSSKHPVASPASHKAARLARPHKGASSPTQTVSTAHELKPASGGKHAAARPQIAGKLAKAKVHPHKTTEQVGAKHKAASVRTKAKARHQLAAKSSDKTDRSGAKATGKVGKKATRKAARNTAAV